MPVKSSYNDPNIGAAFNNIASLFAPPSAQDTAAYAAAAKSRQEAEIAAAAEKRLADYFVAAGGNPDMIAYGLDLYDPTNSIEAMQRKDATERRGDDLQLQGTKYSANASAGAARYGHDRGYEASTENNMRDNQGRLLVESMNPLAPGETRAGLPGELGAMFGIPEIAPFSGTPKPMTTDEFTAAILSGLSPEIQGAYATRDLKTANTVGVDGKPIITGMGDSLGKQPFVQAGSESKPTNMVAIYRDGTSVPAVQRADGVWRDPQTGAQLAPGFNIVEPGKPTGTNADLGLGLTTGATTQIQPQVLAIDSAIQDVATLRSLMQKSPGSQGMVGWTRGTLQDIIQTGDEAAKQFGGRIADIVQKAEASGEDAGLIGEYFDPTLPAIQAAQNALVWSYATAMSDGGRLSNESLQRARESLGFTGMFANDASVGARLNVAEEGLRSKRDRFAGALKGGVPGAGTASTAPVTINSDEEYEALPPGTEFIGPDGQTRVKE